MRRDDYFIWLHKGLRKGLFDLAVQAGATDWGDQRELAGLALDWNCLLGLLRAHARHERRHLFALLECIRPGSTRSVGADHEALERDLDALEAEFSEAVRGPVPAAGLSWYRALADFIADYLPHLVEEETILMPVLWESCDDEELAATRDSFVAEMGSTEVNLSRRLMLASASGPERLELLSSIGSALPLKSARRAWPAAAAAGRTAAS